MGGPIEQCEVLEERSDNFPKARCAYVKGHRESHRFPAPGEDLSNEIRLRRAIDTATDLDEDWQEKYGRLLAAGAETEQDLLRKRNEVYRERNACVAMMARFARTAHWEAGLGRHSEDDIWDDAWRNIVYIEVPVGGQTKQLSWHIHDSDLPLFEFLPKYDKPWDGHTTEQKYDLMAQFCKEPPG